MNLDAPRRSLFSRILLTIAVISILFQLFTLSVIGILTLVPLGRQSAADLAVLMHNAAQQWSVLGEAQRASFEAALWRDNGLKINHDMARLPTPSKTLPYLYFLESSLQKLNPAHTTLLVSDTPQSGTWYWSDFSPAGNMIRVGFPRDRIGVQPPFALFIVLSVGTIVLLLTAVLLTRRITRPLEDLSRAAKHIGKGEWPEPLSLHGPAELASLANSFNQMSQQIQQLIANRTTMLAGISHDLRTPLARIRLAIAMLPQDIAPDLHHSIERDINDMNILIGQFLEVSRGLDEQQTESINMHVAFSELAERARQVGTEVEMQGNDDCTLELNRTALCRIITNLLENAQRYGSGKPVTIAYHCRDKELRVSIADRGPGIPAEMLNAVFEPFFRLEQSRNLQTGGSGLGLAIAKQLAESNGWQLYLEPRHGGGTVAWLVIKFPSPNSPLSLPATDDE